MARRLILTIFLLVATNAPALGATDTVITMPFENLSKRAEYHWIGESFAGLLSELLDTPGLVSIRPDERNVAFRQEGLPQTAIVTRATMIKIAERAGADLVVMGTYRVAGEGKESTVSVTARVVDIREGRLVGREVNRGGPLLELQRLQGELAFEILYQRNPALPYSRDQIVTQATLPPIGAFENYIKGTITRDREARINFLQRAMKEYSDKNASQYISAAFELGRLYCEASDYKDALPLLELVPEKDPRYDEALFYTGVALDALGQTERALTSQQKLASFLPLYEVYNNIGVILLKLKQHRDAVNHLKPAVDAAPRDPDGIFNLGYAHYLAGDYGEAAAVLRRALERRPSDGEALYILSKAYTASGNRAAGEQAADQAKKALPQFAQWETKGVPRLGRVKTSFSRANYYRYRREQDERLQGQSFVAGKTDTDRLLESARAAFSEGRDEEVLATIGKLLQSTPQNDEAHLLMARVYERRGDLDRAANALRAAVFWNPRLVPAHVLLARISVLRGDCLAARASATRAQQVDPEDAEVKGVAKLVEERCGGNAG